MIKDKDYFLLYWIRAWILKNLKNREDFGLILSLIRNKYKIWKRIGIFKSKNVVILIYPPF